MQVNLNDQEIVESARTYVRVRVRVWWIYVPSPYLSLSIKAQICVFAQAIALIHLVDSG
jgi:hypothetical protein